VTEESGRISPRRARRVALDNGRISLPVPLRSSAPSAVSPGLVLCAKAEDRSAARSDDQALGLRSWSLVARSHFLSRAAG
jgi:hypothetical protein